MSRFDRRSANGQTLYSTGYLDRDGTEIWEGDIVALSDPDDCSVSQHTVVWGEFEDCCVAGETWVLTPPVWMQTVAARHEDLRVVSRP